jgi:histidinol phosphatase-like PHP family hydrolase
LQELIKRSKGRYFRGNLHCHSDLSDGKRTPADVVAAYHDAGYDFIVLSDHFEGEYGWRVTRHARDASRGPHDDPRSGAELGPLE